MGKNEDPYLVTDEKCLPDFATAEARPVSKSDVEKSTIVNQNFANEGITVRLVRKPGSGELAYRTDKLARTIYLLWDDRKYNLTQYRQWKDKLLKRVASNPVEWFLPRGKTPYIHLKPIEDFMAFVENQYVLDNMDLVALAFRNGFRSPENSLFLMMWLVEKTFGTQVPASREDGTGYFKWVAPYNRKLANLVTKDLWNLPGFQRKLASAFGKYMETLWPGYKAAGIRDNNPLVDYYTRLAEKGRSGVKNPEVYTAKNKRIPAKEIKKEKQ